MDFKILDYYDNAISIPRCLLTLSKFTLKLIKMLIYFVIIIHSNSRPYVEHTKIKTIF